jgi:flagellar biosynthesis anti-sigma factor FlgM
MSIRIDGQGPQPPQPSDPEAARRLESTTAVDQSSSAGPARKSADGDRVEVSSDAQLVTAALRAADEVPAIRVDAVERARRALEENRVATDSSRLADRIIDSLLGE